MQVGKGDFTDFRTDLAIERAALSGENIKGIKKSESCSGVAKTTVIEVTDTDGERALGKDKGRYITVEMPAFSSQSDFFDERLGALKNALGQLLPPGGAVLCAGVGNRNITADSLGPLFADKIFATRHIGASLAQSLGLGVGLRSVAAVSTGVLGQTGIESAEYIKLLADGLKPGCVITVDALSAQSPERLGCTVQLSDTGIAPGSGVGNKRCRIDEKTVGVPVIAIGVPTVIGALSLTGGEALPNDRDRALLSGMSVAPKDIDMLVKNAAYLISLAVNCALQPGLDARDLASLMQ